MTTFAQCIRRLPFGPEIIPPPPPTPERTFHRPKPTITRPSFSRENVERHVSFSLDAQTGRDMPQPLPPLAENMACTTASFSSGDSTLCPSPLSDLGDLPPLKNLPPLFFDPQMPEQILVKKRPVTANFPIKSRNPFKFRRASTSSAPSPTPETSEILPVYPSIDRSPTPPVEPGPGKPSLIRRLNMGGRRAYSVNAVTECEFPSYVLSLFPSQQPASAPSSVPTTPRLSPSSFRIAASTSKRSASMDIPTHVSGSPVFVPLSPHQSSPRWSLFGSFARRPRTVSLSQPPARTQPYGPPYNCPLPVPQPRRSSGTRRPAISTQTSTPASHQT